MTSRYVYCPMTSKRLSMRITLADRIRRMFQHHEKPDVYPIVGYNRPVYPGK